MRILDGRSLFYQWDLNQRLTADGLAVGDEVHFSNATMREALVVKAYAQEDGAIVADVPNILLQAAYPVEAFRYIRQGPSEHTIEARTFSVQKRPRPSDYIYTETEVHSIEKLIEDAAKALGDADEALREAGEAIHEALAGKSAVKVGGEVVAEFDADTKLDKVTSKDLDRAYVATYDGKQGTKPITSAPSEWTIPQRDSGGSVRVGRAKRDDAAVPLAQMTEALAEKAGAKEVETLSKKVENLEAGTAPEMFVVDDATAYVKDIPTDAAPFAELIAVGGNTKFETTSNIIGYGENLYGLEYEEWGYNEKYGCACGDGWVEVSMASYDILFSDMFPKAEIGKTYKLSYDTTYLEGEPAIDGYFSVTGIKYGSLYEPFVLTEETYNGYVYLENGHGTEERDEGWMPYPLTTTFYVSLVEVIYEQVELNAKVTALDIVGKNLFDEKAVTSFARGNGTIVNSDAEITSEYIRVKFGVYSHSVSFLPFGVFLRAGQKVTLSADAYIASGGATTLGISFGMSHHDGAGYKTIRKNITLASYDKWERVSFEITVPKDDMYYAVLQGTGNESQYSNMDVRFKNIKVTTDTTDTTFSPYHKTTFAIPAAVQALDGYGWGIPSSTRKLYNSIEWDENGKPTFVQMVARVTYDGTEAWSRGTYQNAIKFEVGVPTMKPNGGILADRYPNGTPSTGLPCAASTPWSFMCFPSNPPDTVEEWKAQLAQWAAEGKPLTVYYELAEPIVTDVSAYFTEDNLIPVEGGGTITAVNEHGLAAPSTIVYQKRGV